ncbi:MAG: hypothetical protein Q9225_007289 [Loekoesia sp. 1 TL-2023]
MAIEAVRLLTEPLSALQGFRLREVNIANALTIPESSDGVEIHTHLRPCNESELDHRGWYEFEISSLGTSDTWIKNCHGFVSAEMGNINKSELFREIEAPCEDTFFDAGAKVRDLDVPSLYATMRQMNINHGPAFQNLLNGSIAGRKTITSLSVPNVASETFEYVIHPTTLDTIIQATFGGLPMNLSRASWYFPEKLAKSVKDFMKINLNDEETAFEKQFLRPSYHFIYDAVAELKDENRESWAWHHKLFYDWMERVVALGTSGALSPECKVWSRSSKEEKRMLYDELSVGDASGRLNVRVGQQLASIVRGEITPLELMMEDNLLDKYYMETPRLKFRAYKHLQRLVELYAVNNPGANVLEIGAGTGGATQTVLKAFSSRGDGSGSLLGHYTFTDISTYFFEAANQKLAAWKGMVDFTKFDIELDPVEQSLAAGSYDLIVASMVLHATKSLHKTMSHVRKLLKPGGWWLSQEPFRKQSPNAPLTVWEDVFKETGFTGINFDIGDCDEAELQSCSVILTTATTTPSYPSPISIVYTTLPSPSWVTQLAQAIRYQTCILPTVEGLDELTSVQDKICIFTAEMGGPFVDGVDRASFEKLQNMLVSSRGVLWLSCGSMMDYKMPALAQTQGLLRTLRLEHPSNRYVHLDFEQGANPWSEDKIDHIVHVLQQAFDYNKEHADIEWEYAVKDTILHVPRVYRDKHEPNSGVDLFPLSQPFHQPGRTLVWEPKSTGSLSDLCFTDGADMSGDIPSGMVQIEAKALGLNFRDVMVGLGQLDDTLTGHDCAGIITRLGHNTEQSGLKVGDRVCGIAQGRFASSSWAYWTAVTKLPDEMSWEDGAAIPVPYITAYHSLVRVAGLRKGESILIHAATGGVGQAAIVVAQRIGTKMFMTCSTEAKRDLLVENYHIDPTCILSSRDASFASVIMTATDGKGVDVVLNSLSGPLLKATWSCIARFGRFVEIGKVDIEAARCLDTTPFGRCATYVGVDILQLNEYKGSLIHEALAESVHICHARAKNGAKRPMYPIQRYSISDMEKAMRLMQSGLHIGKLVLVPNEGDKVDVISRPRPLSLANPDATYLIAGGLGGVGRTIAFWTMENGAKNILLVSRNAESHPDAAELVRTAKAEGCKLQIQNCDISNENSLMNLLTTCSSAILPPIRGVVNCAMVLDDTVMERMKFEQWQRAVQSKVSSSTNLHKHLPNLLFFVMLSSMTGVAGHVSQANYSAGNTFQDALTCHRAASGQPAVSLDLPVITDVGYVATNDSSRGDNRVRARAEALGLISLDMGAILPLVEAAVMHSPQRALPDNAQVMVGIAPWDTLPDGAAIRQDRRFSTLRLDSPRGAAAAASAVAATDPTGMLVRALETLTERVRLVAEAVAKRMAVIFNISAEAIDVAEPMSAHGIDSMVAAELLNWLSRAAKAKISIFEIMESKSLMEFAALIVERSQLVR